MQEIITRGWENLLGRWEGPMSFRVIVQPAVAVMLAIRAGLKDARAGRPAFLWTVFTDASSRHELLRSGWKDIGTVFIVALILDLIYQLIAHPAIHPLELIIAATILAVVPYCLVRGPVTRMARKRQDDAPDRR
jgi:hypothetical protein